MEHQKYRFRKKRRGWGWTPCTRQGWLLLLIAVVGIILSAMRQDLFSVWIIVLCLIAVCFLTGEPIWPFTKKKTEHKK